MAKIENKSKPQPKKKATKPVALKSRVTMQKTKSFGKATPNTATGVKTARQSSGAAMHKSRRKTTPTVATAKKVQINASPPQAKRLAEQSTSKRKPPARQSSLHQVQDKTPVGKNPLEQQQVTSAELRAMLLERRNGILKNMDEIDPTLDDGIPANVGDMVDLAQESSKNDLSLHLAEVESRELGLIDKAIQKINEGTYGVCEKCSDNISAARLKALPFANKCIRCQEEDEQDK